MSAQNKSQNACQNKLAGLPEATLIFAHGAGNDQYSEFMQSSKTLFASHGIDCQLFDFPYMVKARELGKRRPPDKADKLIAAFEAEVARVKSNTAVPLFIGGKSMGGRISTMILESSPALGAVCFGYPFHPPGKPEKTRTEHLQSIAKPLCILQGERDPFGKPEEIASYQLSDSIEVHIVKDGEHSFKPLKKSVLSAEENLAQAVAIAAEFIKKQIKERV